MELIKDEWFKHFRIFLEINGFYKEFMECFQKQQYIPIHYFYNKTRLNYIRIMRSYCSHSIYYEEFKALRLTFESFKWVENGYNFPIEFTMKWCTVSFKWGLYCIKHNIEICSNERFIMLAKYWKDQHWINDSMISKHERKLFDNLKK